MPAAAPYFFIKRWSVVRSIVFFASKGRLDRDRNPRTFSQARRAPGFLAHQMVMAGIRTLEPVDKNPISFGIIIAQLE